MNCEVFGQAPQFRFTPQGWERLTPRGWKTDYRLSGMSEQDGTAFLEATGVEAENINPTDR